ncbi:MAG: hypothetical protein HKN40_02490 [Winogradskyella sp.]|uniref:hypothetical protein n=1 Tax=Winogradskyella sp. TaxID=1883156 RepID=UPI0017C86D52|nr:hypothetical protein [Winogradskyella sp.]
MKEKKKEKYNSDITKEDLNALGNKKNTPRDDYKGDDKQLQNRERPVDFTGKNLDVPNRDIANTNKKTLKDEENELYSQGSGHNDHLEDSDNHQ